MTKLNNKGFTLIEVVLAVLLFGILSTTLFISYKSLFTAREKVDGKIEIYSQAETALSRIIEDLTNFYCEKRPLFKESDEFDFKSKYFFIAENEFNGKTDSTRLMFTSYSHLGFGNDKKDTPALIFYYLKNNILYRGDFTYPYPEEIEEMEKLSFPLCENVSKFKLFFYDEDEKEDETWNSDEEAFYYATPFYIKLQLGLNSGEETEFFETKIKPPVFREKNE